MTDSKLPWFFFCLCIFLVFFNLGGAALFEPDEGRNAEKAREILVLNDWVTPHDNFLPVLDKPMFFYWLVALSLKFFGVSEWAARLPSVLAALGCIVLVYFFARAHWGQWEALWSSLILVTGVEFFLLSRVVIFDMTLTFFISLALLAFYQGVQTEQATWRRIHCFIMYVALGAGTLVKGLVGLVVPGLVIFFYLMLTSQWSVLRRIHLGPGILLFCAIVVPWYFLVDARNPGFLRYYLWDEHFTRFLTPSFNRNEPWYYFLLVVAVGFIPWTLLLPFIVRDWWTRSRDDKTLFLVLWTTLPVVFFSLSRSKMPHYILPIFPALSVLSAASIKDAFETSGYRARRPLMLAWLVECATILYLVSGTFWPVIMPRNIQQSVTEIAVFIRVCAFVLALIWAGFVVANAKGFWQTQRAIFVLHCASAALFLVFVVQIMVETSLERSAKEVAASAARHVDSGAQVVFYDTYLAGMPFYLRSERPVWVVTYARKKRAAFGNFYALRDESDPRSRWGSVAFDFDEFRNIWRETTRPLLVIVKEKNLARLETELGVSPNKLHVVDEYVLLTNR